MSHPVRPYTKPALSPADLLRHVQARGLLVPDPAAAVAALERIGYYRLLIYMRPLQTQPGKTFEPGASFVDVLAIYAFDRELRLLCLDAIERIEVALRSAIVTELANPHGPHFYLDSRHFDSHERHREFLRTAADARCPAITHYHSRYNQPSLPPIWVVMEAITYGALSRLYSGLHITNRKAVAARFGFDESILVSWFRSVNHLRNMCAHHNRVWNSDLRVDQPRVAKALKTEFPVTSTFYARAVVLVALLEVVAPSSGWKQRLFELMGRFTCVPLAAMGFPSDWRERTIWSEREDAGAARPATQLAA